MDDDSRYWVGIVFCEVFVNVIKYGNKEDLLK